MGAIPDRHFRPALLHGEPVSHHAAAGRPSHPVKPPDQEVQHRHDHDGSRACPEQLDRHGLAVLPARLKDEMAELADALVNGTDLRATETLASHAEWAEGFLPKYDKITKDNVMDILKAAGADIMDEPEHRKDVRHSNVLLQLFNCVLWQI